MAVARTEGRWARIPNAWIYDDGLRRFSAAPRFRGATGAALKVLIAILVRAVNKRADQAGEDQGCATLSYAQLIELTDLSRALVARGVALLKKTDILTVETAPGRTSRYRLNGYGPTDTYGRLPKTPLFRGPNIQALRTLYDLSLRNEADVNAMKLYLLLCGTQDRNSRIALVTHQTIWSMTSIPKEKIRRALSVLYEHGLVAATLVEQPDGKPPATGYRVLGL
jgi:DNA-binding transcriptional ArsR family regulator